MAPRRAFLRTFLERDLPGLGVNVAAETMRRFWTMLAHHHGQLWNASKFGRSFGVADTTVRGCLDKLTDAFVVRQLPPWHENIGKLPEELWPAEHLLQFGEQVLGAKDLDYVFSGEFEQAVGWAGPEQRGNRAGHS